MLVADANPATEHPSVIAVPMGGAVLTLQRVRSVGDVLFNHLTDGGCVLLVQQFQPLVGVIAEFLVPVTQHRLPARGEVDNAAREIPVEEAVVGVLSQQRVAGLALPEGQLRPEEVRGVPAVEHQRPEAHVIEPIKEADLEVAPATIRVREPDLHRARIIA